ncbi:MAG: hypothetical protein Rubg2KO_39620 [Rubricoccaceae bacterium]
MADLSTKKNPLHLRDERPDYVRDSSGTEPTEHGDLSEVVQPKIGTDPQDTGSTSIEKPTVSLDPEAVEKAEDEGKGF